MPRAHQAARFRWQAVENLLNRARHLASAQVLNPNDYLILSTLLKDCRLNGTDRAVAAYSRLRRLTGRCNAVVAASIKRLTQAGLMQKMKTSVLVLWANGGRRWVQMPNAYRFVEPTRCESKPQTDLLKHHSLSLTGRPGEAIAARKVAEERQWRALMEGVARRIEEAEGAAMAAERIAVEPWRLMP
jgi:predicted transcriptional regulator